MRDAWLKQTREWLAVTEKLLPLPEQEFAAWAISRAIPVARTTGALIFLWGESGSGKSSLIRQAVRQSPETRRRKVVRMLAADLVAYLSEPSADFDPFRGLDVVICEDLQQAADLEHGCRLANWLDELRAEGTNFLISADRLPSEIDGLPPRLVNRLQGGLLAGIHPLSETSQQRLWATWSDQEPFEPRPFMRQSGSTTVGKLKASFHHPRGSVVRETASDGSKSVILLESIAEAVAHEFDVPKDGLRSGSRTQQIKTPRGVAMSLARELTSCPLTVIARHFGCHSHSAVTRNCSRLQQLLPDAPSLRQQVERLRAKLRDELSADCG